MRPRAPWLGRRAAAAIWLAALLGCGLGGASSAGAQSSQGLSAEHAVRECLSREGARQHDSGPTQGLNTRARCLFVHATPCARQAGSTHATMACHDDEAAAWDRLLNEVYGRLRTTAPAAVFSALQAHQRSWPAFRDAVCRRFVADPAQLTSLGQTAERACLLRHSAQRALYLLELESELRRPGDTP